MRNLSRVFLRSLGFLLIFFLLIPILTSVAHAQTLSPSTYQFVSPNVDPDVPQNQHTFIQSLFLETFLAIDCQLTGIDFANPTKSCLGLDLKTGKFGYAPSNLSQQGNLPIGGLLGIATQGISTMYTPTFSSHDYFGYLSDNFGIVKQTHAAAYTGFQGLEPILTLWKTTRDIAYYLLVIAFIFIGIGVMLRLKIDPRTVMTVQNQIPRVIICIILITFSYAFAGLLIDTMWTVTYMGINKITEASNPIIDNGDHLDKVATQHLLSTPFGFVNSVFEAPGGAGGILNIGWGVGQAIGKIETSIIVSLIFGGQNVTTGCVEKTLGIPTGLNIGGCAQAFISDLLGFLWFFIVAVVLLIALFRIWFELLKAYLMVLIYVILAPIWIVFGLLPKRPLGFERWLRVYFANLAVFPAVVLILVGARILHEIFNGSTLLTTQYRFVPPLVGNPAANSFGSILEFGMILMAPQLLSIIREKLGTPPLKQFNQAMQTFNAGRAAVTAVPKQALKHWNKRDQAGNAIGPLASLVDKKLINPISRIPVVGKMSGLDKGEFTKEHFSPRGYDDADTLRKRAGQKGSTTEWARNAGFDPRYGKFGGLSAAELETAGIKNLSNTEKAAADSQARGQGKPRPRNEQELLNDNLKGDQTTQPTTEAGAPPAGAGGPGAPAAGSSTGAAPAGHTLTVKIEGSETPIDLTQPGSTNEVVMRHIRGVGSINQTEKDNLANAINTQSQTTEGGYWNKPVNELSNEERDNVQATINTHINPTAGPGPATNPEEGTS